MTRYRTRYTDRDHRVADAFDAALLAQGVTPIACGNGPIIPRAQAEALLKCAEITLRLDLAELGRLALKGDVAGMRHWSGIVEEDDARVAEARAALAEFGEVA